MKPDGCYSSVKKKTDGIFIETGQSSWSGESSTTIPSTTTTTTTPISPKLNLIKLKLKHYLFNLRTLLILTVLIPTTHFLHIHGHKIPSFLRPIWQTGPPKPFTTLTHYYHPSLPMSTQCSLHNWTIRPYPRRVYDAVLFNNELDMLELRWRELSPLITQFVLLESNSTFTSLPKPLFFANTLSSNTTTRFDFVKTRLTYGTIPGRFVPTENPFIEEAYQRVALNRLLTLAGIDADDLLIMSDVDEIPSRHTLDLLRWCDGYPPILHLGMKNYLYSYEFPLDDASWRASVHVYRPGSTRYAHYRGSDHLLADAGWHCSFCFRTLEEFVFKMKAYSHSDRVRFDEFLEPERIQRLICSGDDLFDMLPDDVFTFREMIAKWGPIPRSMSAVNLPVYLLENAQRFRYLLPGNCVREKKKKSNGIVAY